MATLLLRRADWLVTMDDDRRVLADAGLFARDGVLEQVGATADLPPTADEVIDARGYVVMPGLVNAHHHLFQALTRCAPPGQNASQAYLGPTNWLQAHYPLWRGLTGQAFYASVRLVLAELLLSGCTTVFDQHYLFPADTRLDVEVQAARELGARLVAGRGGQSIGEHNGGVAPRELCEDEAAILADCERLVRAYHDPAPRAMCQLVIAPVQLFRISRGCAADLIALARAHGVRGHTHLCETEGEFPVYQQLYGCRPLDFAEQVGWIGSDVWYAHGIHFNQAEIARLGQAGAGVAHCPTSNMRLATGIAPVRQLRQAGVAVGLGVDGSASNDSSAMLLEARMALLLQRVGGDPAALTAEDALELATRGGAQLLGRPELGSLAPGQAADIVGWDTRRREFAGALADPVAALVLCVVPTVDLSVVNGRVLVRHGDLLGFDWEHAIADLNDAAAGLVERAERGGRPFRRRPRPAATPATAEVPPRP
jgi:8-oxoguanine deaminase